MFYPTNPNDGGMMPYVGVQNVIPGDKPFFSRKLEKGKSKDMAVICEERRKAVVAVTESVLASLQAQEAQETHPHRVRTAIAKMDEEVKAMQLINAKTASEISLLNAQEEHTRQKTRQEAEIHAITISQLTETNTLDNAGKAINIQKDEIKRNILSLEEQTRRIDLEKYHRDFQAKYGG